MAIIVFTVGFLITLSPILTLTIQVLVGAAIVFVTGEILKIDEYIFLKSSILEKFRFIKLN